jgi:signal transduction histidine kinase
VLGGLHAPYCQRVRQIRSEFEGAFDAEEGQLGMIQRQLPIYRQMSARDSVMPYIAHPNDNGLQPDRREHDRLDRAFDVALGERSATERSARAAQRLAALGEMTGGIVHDFRNLLAVIESGLRLAEKNSEQSDKVHVYIAAAREAIGPRVEIDFPAFGFCEAAGT